MAKILVVDDEEVLRDLISRLLEAAGHMVLCAPDGPTAESLAVKEKPDIILLDIFMPGKNGVEVLRFLRQKLPETAVIMISGNADQLLAQACLEIGACDYLTKPLDIEEVVAAIKTRMGKRGIQ